MLRVFEVVPGECGGGDRDGPLGSDGHKRAAPLGREVCFLLTGLRISTEELPAWLGQERRRKDSASQSVGYCRRERN